MTTDSHTLDRLQMHTGKPAPDPVMTLVQRTAFHVFRLLPGSYSLQVCPAAVMALLSGMHVCSTPCQPAKQAPCTCLPDLMPYCLRQHQGANFFAASGCMHWCNFMAQV